MVRWYRRPVILLLTLGLATGLFLALFSMLQASQGEAGSVLCVVPPAEPPGPFAACDQVFTAIQTAVDAAVPGDEIWVATGIYTDVHEREGLRQIVYLDKTLTLRGGYVPPFDAPPDPVANLTVLDAGGQGRVVYITGTAVSLSNFHITGGNATGLGPGPWDGVGGGLYADNADITLNDTIVYSNTASFTHGGGGGIAVQDSSITMTGNLVRNNVAVYMGYGAGGGIMVQRSNFHLVDNTIVSNTAVFTGTDSFSIQGFGGGIAIGDSQGQLLGNHIEDNVALNSGHLGLGGGIYIDQWESTQTYHLILDNNLIRRNIASIHSNSSDGSGGGIFLEGPNQELAPPLQVTMTNNVIQENVGTVSGPSSYAGGIAVFRNTILTFTYNTVISNTALISGGAGLIGGLGTSNVIGTLAYNRFIGNVAVVSGTFGFTGGLYLHKGRIDQHNDLIQGNVANQAGEGIGGGILFEEVTATLTNVVVTDNRADTEGAALWLGSADVTLRHPTLARNLGDHAIYLTKGFDSGAPSTMSLTNALLSDHPVGIVVTGTSRASIQGVLWHDIPIATSVGPLAKVTIAHQVVGNPLFAADGYHLTEGSAAIGQGVFSGVTTDIDGEGRPFFPALGADEYWAYRLQFPLIFTSMEQQ